MNTGETPEPLLHTFPGALCYLDRQHKDPLGIREHTAPFNDPAFTERHLQALWFDERFRPKTFTTTEGKTLICLHPGQWNLETGPDFLNATWEIEGQERQGDVEIHIHPAGWKQHGHAQHPAYKKVQLHLSFFPGKVAQLPPGCTEIEIASQLKEPPENLFGKIDITAYPYEIESAFTPLKQDLATLTPDEITTFLNAAGEERLRQKALRIKRLLTSMAPEQLLYSEILQALGYKKNKIPFKKLADRLPLHLLREHTNNELVPAWSLLLGVGGIMPQQLTEREKIVPPQWIKKAWDRWWKHKDAWQEHEISRTEWDFSGLRPANHPLRRTLAAAQLFTQLPRLEVELLSYPQEDPEKWIKHSLDLLDVQSAFPFGSGQKAALLGKARATHILINVLVPFCAALHQDTLFKQGLLERLPAEPTNQIIKQTAHALLGRDHAPSLYRQCLARQGLIQLFHDYGLLSR